MKEALIWVVDIVAWAYLMAVLWHVFFGDSGGEVDGKPS